MDPIKMENSKREEGCDNGGETESGPKETRSGQYTIAMVMIPPLSCT